MKTQNNDAVNSFIIEQTLISPIQKIITELGAKTYRDCDIKWLDDKLQKFMVFAAETLFIKGVFIPKESNYPHFNEYVYKYYTEKFNALLSYFKSF